MQVYITRTRHKNGEWTTNFLRIDNDSAAWQDDKHGATLFDLVVAKKYVEICIICGADKSWGYKTLSENARDGIDY